MGGNTLWKSTSAFSHAEHEVAVVLLQADGNLLGYDASGQLVFDVRTPQNSTEGPFLTVLANGNGVLYSSMGLVLWTTGTLMTSKCCLEDDDRFQFSSYHDCCCLYEYGFDCSDKGASMRCYAQCDADARMNPELYGGDDPFLE